MTSPEPRPTNHRVFSAPAPGPAELPPEKASPDDPPHGSGRSRRRWWAALGALLALGAPVGLWFALPVRAVSVSGHSRLSGAQVRDLAGLSPGFSWAYYGAWRARGLLESPWVESARIVRRFPDAVEITVTERVPFARWRQPGGAVVTVAGDGTVLPGAGGTAALPLLGGWGPDRLPDALFVARALERYNVQSVAYTPSGVTARTAGGTVWSGDLRTLLKYAGSLAQFPGKQIHIYPWGVSVQE